MLSRAYSAQTVGLKAHTISIEVDISSGLYSFSVVGLPDKAVEESRDRVSSAIKSAGFVPPSKGNNCRVVVSLAPADLKKEGPSFDLPIALAYLASDEEIAFDTEGRLFLGELYLSGELQPIKGVLPLVRHAKESGYKEVYVPKANAREAALIDGITIYGAETLWDVVCHINTKRERKDHGDIPIPHITLEPQKKTPFQTIKPTHFISLGDVRGQESAKRGLEIAAAGGHNIAFYGPPGTGKTLLAKAFASILPPLSFEEALEVTGIHSIAGRLGDDLIGYPPFRAPHHTASHIAITGGGAFPKPGEATLAHRGVLFMDEFPEFDKRVLEALRQPLEDGVVSIARVKRSEIFPAEFILIAAMNPCPCGYRGDSRKECPCAQGAIQKYQRKVSGPIMDRIDMWIEVPRIEHEKLTLHGGANEEKKEKETRDMREKVRKARDMQKKRFKGMPHIRTNARIGVRELQHVANLTAEAEGVLTQLAKSMDLSARAYHRVIKLSRTIADLFGLEEITKDHILEALQYRPKDGLFR